MEVGVFEWVRLGERVFLTVAFIGVISGLLLAYRRRGGEASGDRTRVALKVGSFEVNVEFVIPLALVVLMIGYAHVALSNGIERTVMNEAGALQQTRQFDDRRGGGIDIQRELFAQLVGREFDPIARVTAMAAVDLAITIDRLQRDGNLAVDRLLADETLSLAELQERIRNLSEEGTRR